MSILLKTQELIRKYGLRPNVLAVNPFEVRLKNPTAMAGFFEMSQKYETELLSTYKNRIPAGWYGFDTAGFTETWYLAIIDFLKLLEIDSPNFEICQIKLKMGSARIYLGNISISAQHAINALGEVMYDENLIY